MNPITISRNILEFFTQIDHLCKHDPNHKNLDKKSYPYLLDSVINKIANSIFSKKNRTDLLFMSHDLGDKILSKLDLDSLGYIQDLSNSIYMQIASTEISFDLLRKIISAAKRNYFYSNELLKLDETLSVWEDESYIYLNNLSPPPQNLVKKINFWSNLSRKEKEKVTKLDLSCSILTNKILSSVVACSPSIQELNISDCPWLTEEAIDYLRWLPDLKLLNISASSNIESKGYRELSSLIEVYDFLSNCYGIEEKFFSENLSRMTNLRSLKITDAYQITDDNIDLKNNSNIQEIWITKALHVNGSFLKNISKVQKENLTTIYLEDINITDSTVLLELKGCSSLTSLYLKSLNLSNGSLQRICRYLTVLEVLEIEKIPTISDLSLKNLHLLKNLKYLNLSECQRLTNKTLLHISQMDNLEKLCLNGEHQMNDFSPLLNCKKLHSLSLSYNSNIKNSSLIPIAILPNLAQLYIYQSKFLDWGCLELFSGIKRNVVIDLLSIQIENGAFPMDKIEESIKLYPLLGFNISENN